MRIGHLEKAILTILLKQGAKTSYELIRQIEGGEGRLDWTRQKAFLRTIKQLCEKSLIVAKPYFKYEPHFIPFFSHRFWAEGTYWKRYCGSGFYREKTRCFDHGYYHIFGLTHKGKTLASNS